MSRITTETLDQALHALEAFLEDAEASPESLVIVGGSALLALGFVSRTTRDTDILARVDLLHGLVDPRPMSEALQSAARRVAQEFDLDGNWLNTGPADQLSAGLPHGFSERLTARSYGPLLTIHLPHRYDLIHLKLFAAVDQGMGRHVHDLVALKPTDSEMLDAARWVLTQDAGEVFPSIVRNTLIEMGHERIADRI